MMDSKWPMVPLGEVLRSSKEFIRIDELQIYPKLSVSFMAKACIA